jgi:hypothetical protein
VRLQPLGHLSDALRSDCFDSNSCREPPTNQLPTFALARH